MPIRRPLRSARSLAIAGLALLFALGFSACGSEDPNEVLDQAFNNQIESADTSLVAEARLRGAGAQAQQPFSLRLSGPFRKSPPKALPGLDWRITASAGGTSQAARLITVPDNAFVEFMGQTYEVGRETVKQATANQTDQQTLGDFGIKASTWIKDAQERGEEEVAGEDTTHLSGVLDVGQVIRDSNRISRQQGSRPLVPGAPAPQQVPEQQIAQIERAIKPPAVDVFVGDDGKFRRLVFNIDFTVPPEQQAAGGGVQGGTVKITSEFANVDGDQQIKAPANARPIGELIQQFGLPPGALGPGAPGQK